MLQSLRTAFTTLKSLRKALEFHKNHLWRYEEKMECIGINFKINQPGDTVDIPSLYLIDPRAGKKRVLRMHTEANHNEADAVLCTEMDLVAKRR